MFVSTRLRQNLAPTPTKPTGSAIRPDATMSTQAGSMLGGIAFAAVASGALMAAFFSVSAPGPATIIRAQSEQAKDKEILAKLKSRDSKDMKKPLRRMSSGEYIHVSNPERAVGSAYGPPGRTVR